jgi:broad specificity phosphatase PhoE
MHIYTSDLKRAFSTAEAVHDAQPAPQPPLTKSRLLREQHWGIAEGQPWDINTIPGLSLEEHYKKGVFPVLDGRDEHFPEGESLNHLRARADQAINEIVRPHILESARAGLKGVHIAIVSHGLCISELVPALLDLSASPGEDGSKRYSGLRNTAWTRVVVDVKVRRS